ncbi:hypothetical protein LEP1GSC088_4845 [Leptospira interrogans str. L1207]|nr:hypothetical protein LEP1GSC088_4845 [Leptospira interrogans str. L1207]
MILRTNSKSSGSYIHLLEIIDPNFLKAKNSGVSAFQSFTVKYRFYGSSHRLSRIINF